MLGQTVCVQPFPARHAGVNARVTIRDRRADTAVNLLPVDFFERLYQQVGSAEFRVETCKSELEHRYLFADGVGVDPNQEAVLRAADLYTAFADGRFAALEVVWTHPSPSRTRAFLLPAGKPGPPPDFGGDKP